MTNCNLPEHLLPLRRPLQCPRGCTYPSGGWWGQRGACRSWQRLADPVGGQTGVDGSEHHLWRHSPGLAEQDGGMAAATQRFPSERRAGRSPELGERGSMPPAATLITLFQGNKILWNLGSLITAEGAGPRKPQPELIRRLAGDEGRQPPGSWDGRLLEETGGCINPLPGPVRRTGYPDPGEGVEASRYPVGHPQPPCQWGESAAGRRQSGYRLCPSKENKRRLRGGRQRGQDLVPQETARATRLGLGGSTKPPPRGPGRPGTGCVKPVGLGATSEGMWLPPWV